MSHPFAQKYTLDDWMIMLRGRVPAERWPDFEDFIINWMRPLKFHELPASCYYHGCEPGGWVDHCTRVAKIAEAIASSVFLGDIPVASAVICGAFHDLNKLGFLTKEGAMPRYLKNDKFDPLKPIDKKTNAPYHYNPAIPELPSTHWITMVASTWLPLNFMEWKAICFHDGQYVPENVAVFSTHNAEPLLLTLGYSDMMAGMIEKGVPLDQHSDLMMVRPSLKG